MVESLVFFAVLFARSLFAEPRYLIRAGDAVSQFANVILLDGDPNESISGRSYREGWSTAVRVIDAVFGTGHCCDAYFVDVRRASATLRGHSSRGANK